MQVFSIRVGGPALPSLMAAAACLLALKAFVLPFPRGGTAALGTEPICGPTIARSDVQRPVGTVQPISSYPLQNVPGKRVTIVRVSYPPGGYTPPHYHGGSVSAFVTVGRVRSRIAGGPVETFEPGGSFYEPPGAIHQVSENASSSEPAELIAVFVADEGATLTTFLD